MSDLSRYWHTVRHLKPVQVYGRIWFRLSRPRADLRRAPSCRPVPAPLRPPIEYQPSMTSPRQFCFLNHHGDLAKGGWDDPTREKLWRYNLHYFDDLNARDADDRRDWHCGLLAEWVRDNTPGRGTAWEPYPTSRRIVNWIKWALRGNPLTPALADSLAAQTRWLSRRLEIHLLGNHLATNAKALVFAGLFFEGTEAEAWMERGLGILAREIPEQILADGGHFERSPMYHALALEDLLDLHNILGIQREAIPPRWRPVVARWCYLVGPMRRWLRAMSHPDGDIGFFNDTALGIAPTPDELDRYARRLEFPEPAVSSGRITHLAPSGYIRLERGPAVALLDVAPIGPDYLPGHAHADTLSLELSLFGQRILVNSGTSCYGTGTERVRQRGTAAHNTVVVDGADSSEVWSGFRVARRARPVGLDVRDDTVTTVRCAHDGYDRLAGRPHHTRWWSLSESTLLVEDRLTGRYRQAVARFHLHPLVQVHELPPSGEGDTVGLLLPRRQVIRLAVRGATLSVQPSTWHPTFGTSQPNLCLVLEATGNVIQTEVTWEGAA